MTKTKILWLSIFTVALLLAALTFLKLKKQENLKQKAVLAQEARKVMGKVMLDMYQHRQKTLWDVPVDGRWHDRRALLARDDVGGLRIRRQQETPDILEVQIEAQKNVSLVYNLRIRIQP